MYRRQRLLQVFGRDEATGFKGKILVASHRRSGTHLTINTLLLNTNLRKDYAIDEGSGWGLDKRSQIHKTHRFAEEIDFSDYKVVIYVYRDPVDVLFSYYRFIKSSDYQWGSSKTVTWDSFDDFCSSKLPSLWLKNFPESIGETPETFLDLWCAHIESWRRQRDRSNGLVKMISFEAVKSNPDAVLGCIRGFDEITVHSHGLPSLKNSPSILPGEGMSKKDHVISDEDVLEKFRKARRDFYEPLVGEQSPS